MRLSDESTYEMVHSGLHAIELSEDVSGSRITGNNAILSSGNQQSLEQLRTKTTTLTGSTMVNSHDASGSPKSEITEELSREAQLQNFNHKIWRPWWDTYLARCTDFMKAAKNSDYDTVARLISQDFGADLAVNVNYQEPKTGYSALHYAVLKGDTKLVNLLVKNYSDVKAQDANKQNPLHLVCIAGNLEIFRILLGACYGANEGVDAHGKTPLDYAKDKKHKEIIEFLRSTTNMLYSIEKVTLAATLEERKRQASGRVSRPLTIRNFNVQTKDFKRIGVLGQGAYA